MKKSLTLLTLLFVGISAFTQVLKPVKIDSTCTVMLPKDFTKQDTLGQQIYTGNSMFGYVMIIRAANPPGKPLKREKDLNKVLKAFENKLLTSARRGNIVNDHDTVFNNNLLARDFTLQTDTGSGVQERHFRVVYTQNFTYSFQYLDNEAQAEVADKEMKTFFNGIRFTPDINREDQYSLKGQFTGMHKALKTGLIAGGAVIILIIALVIARRRKKQQ